MKENKLKINNKSKREFNKTYINANRYNFSRLIVSNNGITLITLVIIIIILLVVAVVTMNMNLENNIYKTSGNVWEWTKENYIGNKVSI